MSPLDFSDRHYACDNEPLLYKCGVINTNQITWRSDRYIRPSTTAHISFSSDDNVNSVMSNFHATAILSNNQGKNLYSKLCVEAKSSIEKTNIIMMLQLQCHVTTLQVSGKIANTNLDTSLLYVGNISFGGARTF